MAGLERTEVILWDLMDTLVRDPFFTHMASFFELSFEDLLHQKHPTAWRDFELSTIDEESLYARFFRDGRSIDGPGLKRCMQSGYVWIDGMEDLVAELHAGGIPMHLLSNYPHWFELCDERTGFSRFVEPSFVSCKTGVRKPEAQAYLGALETLGVAPARCLFVDDRSPNCEAARALGIDVIHFEGDVRELRAQLTTRGLLPP